MSVLEIGRKVEPSDLRPGDAPATLSADALTRHAVCIGMTGSGKTGLCVALLEEIAAAGVPVIVIDPKGDMANLALAFEEVDAAALAPWIDPALAERAGQTVEAFAEAAAEKACRARAAFGLDAERVRAFTRGAKVTVYTPGSTAGVPVNALGSFAAPPPELEADEEGLRELAAGTATALLGLVREAGGGPEDPRQLVVGALLEDAWARGIDLDLAGVITRIVDPPFAKIGVFPLDTVLPRDERMKLAMKLNGLLASRAFAAWTQGAPLEPSELLRPGAVSVFSMAHLDDAQRSFFATLLLDRLVAWSRRQPGTSTLRALVYFDEVFGYVPPHPANPPAKRPILTLMKQARAVGVGVVLVTQNPVDIDYKALANAGTWLIGRLQTEQDRERVLDGLAGSAGGAVRGWLERLPPRTFVHLSADRAAPELIYSRQTISMLRGPLTRREIERLPKPDLAPAPPERLAADHPRAAVGGRPPGVTDAPPPAPRGYPYRWLDPRVAHSARLLELFERHLRPARADGKILWEPALVATLHLRFDERDFVQERAEQRLFFPLDDLDADAEPAFEPGDLLAAPQPGLYAALPAHVDEAAELAAIEQRVVEDVFRGETERMWRHRGMKLESRAGEGREPFLARVEAAIEERVHADVRRLKDDVDRKVARLEEKRRRLERDLEKRQADARGRQVTEAVGLAETVFGFFFGRKRSLSTTVQRRNQTSAAHERVSRTEAELADVADEARRLEEETADAIARIEAKHGAELANVEELDVRLDRGDLRLDSFGIVWVPVTRAI